MSEDTSLPRVSYRDPAGSFIDSILSWATIGLRAEQLMFEYDRAQQTAYLLNLDRVNTLLGQLNAALESAKTIDARLAQEIRDHLLRAMTHTEAIAEAIASGRGDSCLDEIQNCTATMRIVVGLAAIRIRDLATPCSPF